MVMERTVMSIQTSAETEAVARQLAALSGQSVEEAVSAALRAELARRQAAEAKIARVMALVRAAQPSNATDPQDRTAFLYDESGMPW